MVKKIYKTISIGVIGILTGFLTLLGMQKSGNEHILTDFSDSSLKFFFSLNKEESRLYADASAPAFANGGGGANNGQGSAS